MAGETLDQVYCRAARPGPSDFGAVARQCERDDEPATLAAIATGALGQASTTLVGATDWEVLRTKRAVEQAPPDVGDCPGSG